MTDYTKIVCFDLEMCCWDDPEQARDVGEIISIGLVEMCLATGKQLRTAEYIVKPEKDTVSSFCTKLTGITQAQVDKQGKPLEKVLERIKAKFGGAHKVYVAWGNDAFVLDEECAEKGFFSPITNSINAALLFMVKHRHNGGRIGMKKAMTQYGLDFEGRQHNALVDAKNLAKLIHITKLL
jgi:inhibitor of KinA sporulation pathway (predicted exonuclease)